MEPVFQELQRTVRHLLEGGGDAAATFVEQFLADQSPPERKQRFVTGFPARLVLQAAEFILRAQLFEVSAVDRTRREIRAVLQREFSGKPAWLADLPSGRREWRLRVVVRIAVRPDGEVVLGMAPALASWADAFKRELRGTLDEHPPGEVALEHTVAAALAATGRADPVLAPADRLDGPYIGTLRDYSGCATADEVRDLDGREGGVLPLGRHAFQRPGEALETSGMLYLAPMRQHGRLVPREHQGTLVCAPPNAGKTALILRWAQAANAAGYNLLIVDVKGNLLDKLRAAGTWRGELFHLTTDPSVSPGDDGCHAMNVLEGLDPQSPMVIQRVRQVAEALLPGEGLQQGETRVWRSNWLNWLTALIHLVLLDQFYWTMAERRADLSDVYDLAADEAVLEECLLRIDLAERQNLAEGREIIEPGLHTWFGDIAVLMTDKPIVPEHEELDRRELRGARAEYSYRWLTEQLTGALRPFRRHGLLYGKTSGWHALPHFTLERLAGLNDALRPTGGQVTVLLAAREQELDDAQTLLTLAVIKLEHALYDRMPHAGDPALVPVLLLLDETRRIRNFRVNQYVSYAREAEAGCVVVYQTLDQIGTDAQVRELLSTVGCQIYLESLTGGTAQKFIERLPTRDRRTFTIATSGTDAPAGLQIGTQSIPFFSTADLHALPAGEHPALVYLRDRPARPPILVSLAEAPGA